ncbi:MAG: SLBB domain-containing protein [Capsulimonadaceae bacterium]
MKSGWTTAFIAVNLYFAAVCSLPAAPVTYSVQPYVIGQGDQLDISVQGHDELKSSVTVLPDGTINYPIVGTVRAAGHSIAELTQELTDQLSVQIKQPSVTVAVSTSSPRKVSALGAVRSPGIFDWKPGWRLLDLVAACGGTEQNPEFTTGTLVSAGGAVSISVDFVKLISDADDAQNVPVLPGDVLLVQDTAPVQVIGEVEKPGPVNIPSTGESVEDVINQDGGGTAKAALTRVEITHGSQETVVDARPEKDSPERSGSLTIVLPGDVVDVPANESRVTVFGEVKTPGAYEVPDGGTLTELQAIAAAGGTTSDSDIKHTAIVGQTSGAHPMVVDMEPYIKGESGQSSPMLHDGDMVYIPTRHKGKSGLDVLQALSPLALIVSLARAGL